MAAVALCLLLGISFTSATYERARPVGEPRFCSNEGQLCFSYDRSSPIGPPSWFNVCQTRRCFFGYNQSPIHIDPSNVKDCCGPRIGYRGNPEVKGNVINEGIYPLFETEEHPALSGVPGFENETFQFSGMHVHFRGFSSEGQEHKIGDEDYDAEMHLVNTRKGVDEPFLEEAGISVIAVFFSTKYGKRSSEVDKFLFTLQDRGLWEYRLNLCRKFFRKCRRRIYSAHCFKKYYGDDDNSDNGDNGDNGGNGDNGDNGGDDDIHGFCRRFFSKPKRCRGYNDDNGNGEFGDNGYSDGDGDCDDDECPDDPEQRCLDGDCGEVEITLNLDGLLPERRDFYYYYGSTTSPPVSEVVQWNVMAEPIRITKFQLFLMQQLESRERGIKIAVHGDVRPRQPLNGRTVYKNFCPLKD